MKKLGAISDNKINLGAILVICRINNARKLWQDEYKNLPRPAKASPAPFIREPDEYDLWEREQTVVISHLDEFDRFIKGDPIPLPKGQTSLQWWLESA